MASNWLSVEQSCSEHAELCRGGRQGKLQSAGERRIGCAKLSKNNSGPNRGLNARCWTVIAVGDEDKEIRPGQLVTGGFTEEAAGNEARGRNRIWM